MQSGPGYDWWSAELSLPAEAAAVNFVINYYDHYDNNNQKDHKLNVRGEGGQRGRGGGRLGEEEVNRTTS